MTSDIGEVSWEGNGPPGYFTRKIDISLLKDFTGQ
jgi:hypothetical protein